MAAITVFDGDDATVPEGTNHEYACGFTDLGASIQLAAITDIRLWLDAVITGGSGVVINSRTNIDVIGTSLGTLTDSGGGVALLTLKLLPADAAIATENAAKAVQLNRLTLKVTFNRVGGGTGQLTHEVLYPVRNLHRIS